MLKKLMLLLCLGAFIAVATVGGCGKKPENGEKEGEEKPPIEEKDTGE